MTGPLASRPVRAAGVVLLTVPGLIGFTAAFGTLRAVLAGAVALVLGALIGWFGAVRRLSAVTTAALTVLVTVLAAGPAALPQTTIAGVVPTLDTMRALGVGVVRCWRNLLTTTVPTGVLGDVLLVPFLTCLVGGVLGVSLAVRTARPAWAVVPAGLVLVVSVLMGTAQPVSLLLEGGLFAVLAVLWLALTSRTWTVPDLTRAVAGLAVLAVAAGVGAFTGPAVTDALGAERYVLRDEVEPPFDIRAYPSPLNGFRKYTNQERDTPLFTVSGATEGSRIRLATMDAYDGTVWNVAGGVEGDGGSSGSFRRLGINPAESANTVVEIQVQGLTGVWMPAMGDLRAVTFTGPRADELGESFRYNAATGTGVLPGGLREGDAYRLSAEVAPEPGRAALEGRAAEPLVQPEPQDVPPVVTSVAADATAEAQGAFARAEAIAETLRTTGYFSDGREDQAVSRAGHGAGRLTDLLGAKIWIGDEEQYAAAAGLMARQLGLPARVVMGFQVPAASSDGVAVVTGDHVTAWVEVAFDGVGWVRFDVTPDESRIPPEQAPEPAPEPKPETQQPPPPVEQPPPPLPATGDDEADQDEAESNLPGWLDALLTVVTWVGIPLLVLALPCLVIIGLKARRRRKRRSTGPSYQRVAAGWWEVLDAHRDHGAALPPTGTRREIARTLDRPGTRTIAEQADAAVFSGSTVTDRDAEGFWSLVDRELADLSAGSARVRWRARLSLRSLRRRKP